MANDEDERKKHKNQRQTSADTAQPGSLELEEALSAKLGELSPEPTKEEVTQVVHEVVASFQGPLPPPSILRGYDEIVPGAADRIVAMAEREQAHRHSWEQRALRADHWYSMLGMLAGWTTAMALAVGAAVAAAVGEPAVGVALAAASATGMVWKLIQGRSEKAETPAPAAKEASQKKKNLQGR